MEKIIGIEKHAGKVRKRFDRRKELGRKAWMHFEVIFLRFSSVLLSRERAWPYMASLLAIKVGCLGRRKAATYSLHSSLACIYQTIARLRETRFATTYHIGRDAAFILLNDGAKRNRLPYL